MLPPHLHKLVFMLFLILIERFLYASLYLSIMKVKSLADTREWKKLMKEIGEARKDPEFLNFVREFIKFHTGKPS